MKQKDMVKMQTQAAFILLIPSFLFSQELTWIIIRKIYLLLSDNDISRTGNIISASAAIFFCLYSVVLSDHLKIVESLFSQHLFMRKIATKLSNWILSSCIFVFYRFWDVIFRTDSSAQIRKEQNDILEQPGMMKFVLSITVVAVVLGLVLYLIDGSHPRFVDVIILGAKFVPNLILLFLLLAEVRDGIKRRNTQS